MKKMSRTLNDIEMEKLRLLMQEKLKINKITKETYKSYL